MNEHRVTMLGGAWRRHSDPQRSPDPRVRELVGALAGLEVAPAPRPEFRAELRAQLVAVAPRLVAEGDPTAPAPGPRRVAAAEKAHAEQTRTGRVRRKIVKPLIAAACVLTAFVLLLGGAVLISQHALPGDALYGIKRASEDTEYSLTGGAVAKGKLKLDFAGRRIGEVAALLPRASALAGGSGAIADGGAINSDTAGLVRDTLGSADDDVQTAAQLLGGNAVRTGQSAPLDAITSWTPAQIEAMRQIVARIPDAALHRRAAATLTLLRMAGQRAGLLRAELGCSCLGSSGADQLGPLPCPGPCASPGRTNPHPAGHPSSSATPKHHPRTSGGPAPRITDPAAPSASDDPTATSAPPSSSTEPAPAAGDSSPGGSSAQTPTGGVSSPKVPTLPGLPGLGGGNSSSGGGHGGSGAHLPISVNSCGASVSVGPVQIGIGGC